jgi:apolipoprotein N-acyltransferase
MNALPLANAPALRPNILLLGVLAIPMLALTALLSHMAWQTSNGLILLPLLTLIMLCLPVRFFPVLVGFVYFFTANWQLKDVFARLDPDAMWMTGWLAAAGISLVQAVPMCLVRHDRSPAQRFGRVLLGWTISVIPPFGLITWMHPSLLAGLLFPGMGLVGILLVIILMAIPAARLGGKDIASRLITAVLCFTIAFSIYAIRESKISPALPMMDWFAVDTKIPPAGRWSESYIQPKVPGEVVSEAITESLPAKVLLFPETTFAPMTDADKVSLLSAMYDAKRAGTTVLAGASVITGPDSWRNQLVMLQANLDDPVVLADTRVPMLYGNWRLRGGVPVRPFASDLVQVPTASGTTIAAVSICYEDTLLWPHFGLLTGQADVLLSLGNAWATANTTGDRIQTRSVRLLASMAGVPLVRARNEWHGPVYLRDVQK